MDYIQSKPSQVKKIIIIHLLENTTILSTTFTTYSKLLSNKEKLTYSTILSSFNSQLKTYLGRYNHNREVRQTWQQSRKLKATNETKIRKTKKKHKESAKGESQNNSLLKDPSSYGSSRVSISLKWWHKVNTKHRKKL